MLQEIELLLRPQGICENYAIIYLLHLLKLSKYEVNLSA